MELVGAGHREVVGRRAAHQRDRRSGHAVGAAQDLLVVAREAVGEHEQHPMGSGGDGVDAGGDLRARLPEPGPDPGGGRGGDREAGAAQDHDHHPAIGGAFAGELARRGGADQRGTAAHLPHARHQVGEVVRRGAEDQDQGGVAAGHRLRCRLPPGRPGMWVARPSHRHPAILGGRHPHRDLARRARAHPILQRSQPRQPHRCAARRRVARPPAIGEPTMKPSNFHHAREVGFDRVRPEHGRAPQARWCSRAAVTSVHGRGPSERHLAATVSAPVRLASAAGEWPSGKAADSGSANRRFESYLPSHLCLQSR